MDYNNHGGECCGYFHVYGFDNASEADLDRIIRGHQRDGNNNNRILEAILTDRQLAPVERDQRVIPSVRDAGGWPAILRAKGFKLKTVWRNSNTGRMCYQFHLLPQEERLEDATIAAQWLGETGLIYHQPAVTVQQRPQPQPQARQRPAPVPPPAHDVLTEYFAVFQGGRVGTRIFETSNAVLATYPRASRYRRRTFRSDGTVITNDITFEL